MMRPAGSFGQFEMNPNEFTIAVLSNYYLSLHIKLPLRRNGVTFLTIACYMKILISFFVADWFSVMAYISLLTIDCSL